MWLVLLFFVAFAATWGNAVYVCSTNELVTSPPLGSRIPQTSFASSVFSVDIVAFTLGCYVSPPPDKYNATISPGWPFSPIVVTPSNATQQQLNTWQSWWVDPDNGTQSLFTLQCDGDHYPNSLINVTRLSGGALRLFFRTPPMLQQGVYDTLWVIPGGKSPHWSGKIVRNLVAIDFKYHPQFIDTMAPFWLLNGAPAAQDGYGPQTLYNGSLWWMPPYTPCTDLTQRVPKEPTNVTSYSSSIPFSTQFYQYNSTTKQVCARPFKTSTPTILYS